MVLPRTAIDPRIQFADWLVNRIEELPVAPVLPTLFHADRSRDFRGDSDGAGGGIGGGAGCLPAITTFT